MKFLSPAVAMLISAPAGAADMIIKMLSKDANGNKSVCREEIARVNVGDTITWVQTTKSYNVKMISSPNGMKLKSENRKEVQVTLNETGIYHYWYTPRKGIGMIDLVVVGGDTFYHD